MLSTSVVDKGPGELWGFCRALHTDPPDQRASIGRFCVRTLRRGHVGIGHQALPLEDKDGVQR